jgi:glutamate-1-semialdehyde 2,1-aminomutase
MAAGIATLKELKRPRFYHDLEETTTRLISGLQNAAKQAGIAVTADRVGSMAGLFFSDKPIRNFDDAKTCDLSRFSAYYREMLDRGIYLAPSQFEAVFVSSAHTAEHIDSTIAAAEAVLKKLSA